MQVIKSDLVGVDQGNVILFSHFEDNGPMWADTGQREIRKQVWFSQRFTCPPSVITYPCMWDMDTQMNTRLDIFADNVTEDGFEIIFRTWSDSRIARVHAIWQAIGAVPDSDMWDVD